VDGQVIGFVLDGVCPSQNEILDGILHMLDFCNKGFVRLMYNNPI
jgi:hypothetical protein